MALGSLVLVLLPTILMLNLDRVRTVIDALMKLANGK